MKNLNLHLMPFALSFTILSLIACSPTPAPAPPTGVPTAVAAAPSPTSPPPTDTPVPSTDTPVPPSDTPAPTDTLTSTPTSTPTDTPAPSPTATVTMSSTPMPATATRIRPTPAPSRTPTPAGPKYPAPVLTGPTNGSGFNCRRAPDPSWTWSGPALGPNEWFDLEFTVQGKNEWYGVAWTKETQVVLNTQKAMGPAKFLALFFPRESGLAGMGSVSLLGSEGSRRCSRRLERGRPGGNLGNGNRRVLSRRQLQGVLVARRW